MYWQVLILFICTNNVKLLNRVYHLSVWLGDLRRQVGKRLVAGSIPAGDLHFHCEFSRFSKLDEAHTNEIKHNIHPEQ